MDETSMGREFKKAFSVMICRDRFTFLLLQFWAVKNEEGFALPPLRII